MSEITPNTPNPVREDAYVEELSEKLGIDPQYIPKSPVWRNEEEIRAIAEMFANMSGSSGGGVLVVNSDNNMVLDKTWQEISDAFGNGIVMVNSDDAIEIVTAIRDASHAEAVPSKYNVEAFYVWIDGWDSDLGDWKTTPQASVYVCDSANDYPAQYTPN